MLYRRPKGVESSEKKTISVGAGLGPKISFGDLTITNKLDVKLKKLNKLFSVFLSYVFLEMCRSDSYQQLYKESIAKTRLGLMKSKPDYIYIYIYIYIYLYTHCIYIYAIYIYAIID